MKHLFRSVLTVATVVIGGPALAGQHIVTLSVPGMDCSACPAIVRGSLQKVAGVAKVEVYFERKTAVVTFDDGKASVAELIGATTNAGYPSHEVAGAQ